MELHKAAPGVKARGDSPRGETQRLSSVLYVWTLSKRQKSVVLGFGGSSKKTFTQSHKTHILPSENIVQLKVKRAPPLLRTSANLSPLGRKPCLSRDPMHGAQAVLSHK